MLEIKEALSGDDLQEVLSLFKEYAASLDISLEFQNFEKELASFPGDYVPPNGCLLIARWKGVLAGCVAFRKIADGICEMKRLYTKPSFRKKHIGRSLAETLIDKARQMGYSKMRLDTLSTMENARALYKSLGFYEIEAYCYNPFKNAVFMELDLLKDPSPSKRSFPSCSQSQ